MKFLHTSDWHVGKTLKGRNRLEEQGNVLREIVQSAVAHDVDAVLIAGDIYENSAPTADAQKLVVRTLKALADRGIEVVAIAGNHDHGATFEAYKPVMDVVGIHLYGHARPADKGGVRTFTAKSTGETANVAVLPFLSQRYAVRAAEIIANTPSQNVGEYDQLVRDVIGNLTAGFDTADGAQAVNIVMAHLTCTGGEFGGGERAAQSILEYHVPAGIFPVSAHYVALGHLHRRQELAAGCPVHYSGSPFAVDFGEQDNTSVVVLVEASPGTPAKVTDIPIMSGTRLRTVEGTVANLTDRAAEFGNDFLRLRVAEAAYAGMKDELLAALPNTLEVRIHPDYAETAHKAGVAVDRTAKFPGELFAEYCSSVAVDDARVRELFDRLMDETTACGVRART